MARPLKPVDEDAIFTYASDGFTYEEIGKKIGLSANTVARRYDELIKKGREHAKDSFMRKCYKAAFPESFRDKPNVGFAVLFAKLMGWYVERTEIKSEQPQQTMSDKEIRNYAEFILWQKQKEQNQSEQSQQSTI